MSIQRGIIKGTKAYATLRSDLKRGCVLPPIVLAVTLELRRAPADYFADTDLAGLSEALSCLTAPQVYIIDGLQRTNALRQTAAELADDALEQFLGRPLRIEVWLNIPFGAVAYRMLLLNAGQRPMSVKQQVEVLSSKLVDDLADIPHLSIFRANDARRRAQPGQFSLSKLAQALQAWLQGQPNLDLRNTVMEELLADSAINVLGNSAGAGNDGEGPAEDGFKKFVNWLVELDLAVGADHLHFLGNETALLGIAAAVGSLERSEKLSKRLWPSLTELLDQVKLNGADAIAVSTFERLRQGIDSSKENVGVATREMVFVAFKEFIRDGGDTPMEECWQIAAASKA
ncbi:hypothetical protein [Massilia sp. TS11]|uniref:hypothetical protein n=1 Tax=Massilia sp. TS11 TaxID=2908003 RepID=UPI001EDAC80B|nr:hypothetical protein [Massilia sp. TS11]MCG2583506.1 hypothetical protein [Massilia sp. TS11]